jgi:hypothetical protein
MGTPFPETFCSINKGIFSADIGGIFSGINKFRGGWLGFREPSLGYDSVAVASFAENKLLAPVCCSLYLFLECGFIYQAHEMF